MAIIADGFAKSREFDRIISECPREQWRLLIEPLIESINYTNRCCYIDEMIYEFVPEELDPNYPWEFNIGDIVSDGKHTMRIQSLPLLDPRFNLDISSNIEVAKIQVYGNRYTTTLLNESEDQNDEYLYLHNTFNENQLYLL